MKIYNFSAGPACLPEPVLAAAEAAVALAIVINLFKNVGSVDVDDADLLKG